MSFQPKIKSHTEKPESVTHGQGDTKEFIEATHERAKMSGLTKNLMKLHLRSLKVSQKLYDSAYMEYTEHAKPRDRKQPSICLGLGKEVDGKDKKLLMNVFLSGRDENILDLIVMMVVQVHEYPKNHWIVNCVICEEHVTLKNREILQAQKDDGLCQSDYYKMKRWI